MNAATDFVDFTPDRSQLARTATQAAVSAPPLWLAVLAVAGALGLSLSMALPPTTGVSHGRVSGWSTRGDDDAPARPAETFQPTAWHTATAADTGDH